MNYRDEEFIVGNAYETLENANLVGKIVSAEDECKLPSCLPQATLANLVKTVVSYQEAREIEKKRSRGEEVFKPGQNYSAIKEVSLKGGRVKIAGKALDLFKIFHTSRKEK